MELFGAISVNLEKCRPGFKQYKISRNYIRNYVLHPLICLRVAETLVLEGEEYYLQIHDYIIPSSGKKKGINFRIGNWQDVADQFQGNNFFDISSFPYVEVMIMVYYNHDTGGSASSTVDSVVKPFCLQEMEGLHSHWVNRYFWIVPSKRKKEIARFTHSRHGYRINMGGDKLDIPNKSALYLVPAYGVKVEKII